MQQNFKFIIDYLKRIKINSEIGNYEKFKSEIENAPDFKLNVNNCYLYFYLASFKISPKLKDEW